MDIKFRKFQEGGEMAPQPAQAGGDPTEQLIQLAMQALQNQDCNAAMQVCDILVQMLQQQAPQEAPQGEPVYRKGGILAKRVRK